MNRVTLFLMLAVNVLSVLDYELMADSYVNELGITEGISVSNGYVFLDGQYLEPPYMVSRKGLELFINDKKINNPTRHPGKSLLILKEDPNDLNELERQKTFRALEATRNIYEKCLSRSYGYLFSSRGGHIKLSPYTMAYDFPSIIKFLLSNNSREDKLEYLQPHNWHLFIDIGDFVDNFSITVILTAQLEQLSSALLRIDEFGSNFSEPIDKGIVFLNGKYVETPFRIERRGLGLFINGKMIRRPMEWPVKEYAGITDPDLPAEINNESSINDEIVNDYLLRKHTYIYKHNRNEERELMEQVYRNLPFVTEAKIDEKRPHILHLTTTEGLSVSQSLIYMRGRKIEFDKASVLQCVETERTHYLEALQEEACFIFSGKGGRTRLSKKSIKEKLPVMLDILKSNESSGQKMQELRQNRINISDESLKELVDHFSPSSQLETRINEIRNN